MHWCYYQIVLLIFIILWLYFLNVSRTFRGLRSLMILIVVMLYFHRLLFFNSISFKIPGSYYRLPPYILFTLNKRQLEVACFVKIRVFWSLSYRGSGQSFLFPRYKWKKGKKRKCKMSYLSWMECVFLW